MIARRGNSFAFPGRSTKRSSTWPTPKPVTSARLDDGNPGRESDCSASKCKTGQCIGGDPYRISLRQFEKMVDAGVFRDGDHVELLEGILVDKMTKHPPHNFTVSKIADVFRSVASLDWVVQEEKSVVLGRFSRPEPDIAIARGPRERYRSVCPRAADLAVLIEVADTSYAKDRGSKWRKYAASKILVYWIVNLPLSPDRGLHGALGPWERRRVSSQQGLRCG